MFLLNGPGAFALGDDDRACALAEVNALLRITTSAEDALVGRLADSALGLAEVFLGRLQLARPVRERVSATGHWVALGAAPVSAITLVSDDAGALASGRYAIDIDERGTGWVRSSARGPLTVDYDAGAAARWADIPAPIRSGIVLLAAHLYTAPNAAVPPPAAVTALWRPFRDLGLRARAC